MATSAHPIRIAFCITDLDPGGAERALVQLVTRLDPARWQAAVFCLAGWGRLADVLSSAGIPVVCLGARGARDACALLRLWRELRRFKPEIVQSFLFHGNIAGRIAGKLAGARRIVSGIRVAERRSRTRLWLDRATSRAVDAHVCVSRDVAEFSICKGGLPREQVVVIPNGVDVEAFAAAAPADLVPLGIPSGNRVLLSIGRLDPQKGFLDLVHAAQPIVGRYDDVHFVVVGEGPERPRLESAIREAGLGARFHLAGWRDDVPALLRSAHALVLSSHWEGMPNVVLEAQAAGRPVIATRVEGVAEIVLPDETGLLVPPGDPPALAGAIRRLLDDRSAAEQMGAQGQARVASEFTWDNMARRYESLYESLLTASAAPPLSTGG